MLFRYNSGLLLFYQFDSTFFGIIDDKDLVSEVHYISDQIG